MADPSRYLQRNMVEYIVCARSHYMKIRYLAYTPLERVLLNNMSRAHEVNLVKDNG